MINEKKLNIKFVSGNRVTINPPESTLKITGTRLAGILGINNFTTPFQVWAELCKVYKPPFEENMYTLAGKAIEPKQAEYIREKYKLGNNLLAPKDVFGKNYFKETLGDFYKDKEIFGGMWDYLYKKDGNLNTVLEMKTAQAKNKDKWEKKFEKAIPVPSNYLLQGGLYAYLSNLENLVFVATFLNPDDYDNPNDFVVNDENTKLVSLKMSVHLPRFKIDYIDPAVDWWNKHVVTGESPSFDPSNKDDMLIVEHLQRQKKIEDGPEQLKIGGMYW